MSFRISGRNMKLGETLTERIEERIAESVGKYFDGNYSGHATVEKQGSMFEADCLIHLDTGAVLQASAKDADPKQAFEQAGDRIDKRLRRYKRRLRDHHGNNGGHAGKGRVYDDVPANLTVVQSLDQEEEVPSDYAPLVIAESATSVRTQTVAMAVMQLDMMDEPVNVFRNAASGSVNVVYKRSDGNVGWVDPGSGNAASDIGEGGEAVN